MSATNAWVEGLAVRVLENLRLTDEDRDLENRKRIAAVASSAPRGFGLRPAFGQRRSSTPVPLPRWRGGQPGNGNAIKTGRYRGTRRRPDCMAAERLIASAVATAALADELLAWSRAARACESAGMAIPAFDVTDFLARLEMVRQSGWHPELPAMVDKLDGEICLPVAQQFLSRSAA